MKYSTGSKLGIVALTAFGLIMGGATPATAFSTYDLTAQAPVKTTAKATIKQIPNLVAKANGTVNVQPMIKTTGPVLVTHKSVTVKQGQKFIAKKVPSAKLKAGTYSVTTQVTYKPFSMQDKLVGKKEVTQKIYAKPITVSKTQSLKVTSAVQIKTIPTATSKGKKAVIRPAVTSGTGVSVVSKTITVKQGKKTIVTNKPSASLAKGTYSVTTTVKYKMPVVSVATKTTTKKILPNTSGYYARWSYDCIISGMDPWRTYLYSYDEDDPIHEVTSRSSLLSCTTGADETVFIPAEAFKGGSLTYRDYDFVFGADAATIAIGAKVQGVVQTNWPATYPPFKPFMPLTTREDSSKSATSPVLTVTKTQKVVVK